MPEVKNELLAIAHRLLTGCSQWCNCDLSGRYPCYSVSAYSMQRRPIRRAPICLIQDTQMAWLPSREYSPVFAMPVSQRRQNRIQHVVQLLPRIFGEKTQD
jgi:hypothetical protein